AILAQARAYTYYFAYATTSRLGAPALEASCNVAPPACSPARRAARARAGPLRPTLGRRARRRIHAAGSGGVGGRQQADGLGLGLDPLDGGEWEEVLDATYEKKFSIEVNMTAAREGMPLGAELGCRSDHDPLVVLKMRDVGLVREWNWAHPDTAVQVGDEFVKVGDMKWNRQNDIFMDYLKEKLRSAREQGTTNPLQLGFRRPWKSAPSSEGATREATADVPPQSLLRADAQIATTSEEEGEEEGDGADTTSEEEELLDGMQLFGFLTQAPAPSQPAP
ncbi:unnamed protein product, partial [Prorocentrum cordatum]